MFFGELGSIGGLVAKDHPYRKLKALVDIEKLATGIEGFYTAAAGRQEGLRGRKGPENVDIAVYGRLE